MRARSEPSTVAGEASLGSTRRRRPGFRFSTADAAIIVTVSVATWVFRDDLGQMALLPLVVLGHFILFCNVFRLRRSYELFWAVAFVVNVAAWQFAGRFAWPNVLLAQTPLTLLLIAAEMRGRRYHGVGYRWINPEGGQSP